MEVQWEGGKLKVDNTDRQLLKLFLRLLLLTISIQIIGFVIAFCVDQLLVFEHATILPFYIGSIFVAASIAADIIIVMRKKISVKEKLVCILCMPTNYVWVLIGALVYLFVKILFNIATETPPNFG